MTAFDFSLVKNTSIAFAGATDTISFGSIAAGSLTVTTTGTDTVITDGTDSVTLTGVTPFEFDSGNFLFTNSSSEIIFGDNDNTVLTDDTTNDTMTDTNNTTIAGASNQYIGFGGEDNINLTGTTGDNLVFGGFGVGDPDDDDDTIVLGSGSNTVYGNAGNDTVTFGNVTATGKTAVIYGGAGADAITTGAAIGDVNIIGGNGADILNASGALASSNVTLTGGNGRADSGDLADNIDLGVGSGTIFGNAGNDDIDIGATAVAEVVTAYGGQGNDSIDGAVSVATSVVNLYGNLGNDVITLAATAAGTANIFGGSGTQDSADGADSITAGAGDATIYANAGNDTVTANLGNATVYGGQGNDSIVVGGTNTANTATVFTGSGVDTVNFTSGTVAADTLVATLGDGVDTLNLDLDAAALASHASITGFDAANDIINVTLDGGDAAAALAVDTVAGTVTGNGTAEVLTFTGFNFDFNATNFNISGNGDLITNLFGATATTLTGGANGDQLISGALADTLVAGLGNDKIVGNAGNDVIQIAGDGIDTNDTIDGGAGTGDKIVLNAVTTGGLAAADFTNVTNVEILEYGDFDFGGVAADTLAAQADAAGIRTVDASNLTGTNSISLVFDALFTADVTVTGGAENDTINGSALTATNDLVADGGAGNDVITGGASTDSLTGGAGNDTLLGGGGLDTLTGGDGVDAFSFLLIDTAAEAQTITDFVGGAAGDDILFSKAEESQAGSVTAGVAVAAQTVANVVGGADVVNQIIIDTAANIGANGVSIGDQSGNGNNDYNWAIASDTGAIFYDADGDWTAGGVQIGTMTLTGAFTADNAVIIA